MNLKQLYNYNPSKKWLMGSAKLTEAEFDIVIKALEAYHYKVTVQAETASNETPKELVTALSAAQKLINAASESE